MKPRYWIYVAFILAGLLPASGQEGISPVEFVRLSPGDAAEVLEKAGEAGRVRPYVEAAVASRKLEILKACLSNNYGSILLNESIARMPESEFRDTLIIMKIEAGPVVWGPDGDPNERDGSSWATRKRTKVEEPYASLIKRLLPDHPLDPTEFEWHAKRLKLGAELRAALKPDNQAVHEPPPAPPAAFVEPIPVAAGEPQIEKQGGGRTIAILSGAGVVGILLLIFKRKNRRKPSPSEV